MTEEQANQLISELKDLNKSYHDELIRQSEERDLQKKQDESQKEQAKLDSEVNEKEKLAQKESDDKFKSDLITKIGELDSQIGLSAKDSSVISLSDKLNDIDVINQKLEKIIEVNSTPDLKQETISNLSDLSVILVVWVILPVAIIYKLFVSWWERYF